MNVSLSGSALVGAAKVDVIGVARDYLTIHSSIDNALVVTFDTANAAPGEIAGDLELSAGGAALEVPVDFTVIAASATSIPAGASYPSPSRISTNPDGSEVVGDQINLLIDPGVSSPDAVAMAIAEQYSGDFVGSVKSANLSLYEIRFLGSSPATTAAIASGIRSLPNVQSAGLTDIVQDAETANDPGLTGDGYPNDATKWADYAVDAPAAWQYTTGSSGIAVGVIDYPVDVNHPDLKDATASEPAGGATGIETDQPDYQHGTHVSGVACAQGQNHVGIAGIAWHCGLKVYGTGYQMTTAQVVQGINWQADHGARVVNLSLSSSTSFDCKNAGASISGSQIAELQSVETDARAFFDAVKAHPDTLWVWAAGNGYGSSHVGMDLDCSSGKALSVLPNVIIVGAENNRLTLSNFSNYGAGVDVLAAGGQVGAGTNDEVYSDAPGGEYAYIAGTSQATPQVTGTADLIYSVNPAFTPEQARACIVDSAVAGSAATRNIPRLDVAAAVRCAITAPTISQPSLPQALSGVAYNYQFEAQGMSGSWALTGAAPGLAIDASSGLLSGTPTTSGKFDMQVSYTDALGRAASLSVSLTVINGPCSVKQVSSFSYATLALCSSGLVYAWGFNGSEDALGIGSQYTGATPRVVHGLSNIVQVLTIGRTSYALDSSGQVYGWGAKAWETYEVAVDEYQSTPTAIPGLNNVANLSESANLNGDSFAVTSSGTVVGWGPDPTPLGVQRQGNPNSGFTVAYGPVTIPGLTGVRSVSGDMGGMYAIAANGDVYGWNGATVSGVTYSQPSIIPLLHGCGVVQGLWRGAGGVALCGGVAYVWGTQLAGEAGDGLTHQIQDPTPVVGLPSLSDISAGGDLFIAKGAGNVYSWGIYRGTPTATEIAGLSGVVSLSSASVAFAATSDGSLFGWGDNMADGPIGLLGLGSTQTTFPEPTRISVDG